MAKKASRFQCIREAAQALLNVRGPGALADFSNWQKFARFWVLVWTSFSRNRCPVRASALAYVTVLAIIPMLAVAMSIASGLLKKEGEDQIDQFIVKVIASVIPPATINTNLKTMFLVTHEVVRDMIRRKSGTIVNLGSLGGRRLIEVPVHYKARTYGETQISRFRDGWLLIRMVAFAFQKLKAI